MSSAESAVGSTAFVGASMPAGQAQDSARACLAEQSLALIGRTSLLVAASFGFGPAFIPGTIAFATKFFV